MNRIVSVSMALIIAVLWIIQMAVLIPALMTGQLLEQGQQITGLIWGKMSLVDLYSGLILWGLVVIVVETSWPKRLIWSLAILNLGNPITCMWLLYRWVSHDQSWSLALKPGNF